MADLDANPTHNHPSNTSENFGYQCLSGKVSWKSPSNIAIVKYWGKKPGQIPMNPSLSMTLNEAYTETQVQFAYIGRDKGSLTFLYEGQEKPEFLPKVQQFFEKIAGDYPFLADFQLIIDSRNTFPHSTGIASSASSMSALALCLAEMKSLCMQPFANKEAFMREASRIARIGSGSACRSLYAGWTSWGATEYLEDASDYHGTAVRAIHPVFTEMCDSILIVSALRKKVSSSDGHALMNQHPYAEERFSHAGRQHAKLLQILANGDMEGFIELAESEALALHAMMMTSQPSYLLLEPESLRIIQEIRAFRAETGIPVCFTLDAGPNVHVLYPQKEKNIIFNKLFHNRIQKEFPSLAIIHDSIGSGPQKLN